jgi:hypothetical protein
MRLVESRICISLRDPVQVVYPKSASLDTIEARKLRGFISGLQPQPFDRTVFAKYITGAPGRRLEGNLPRKEAGLALQKLAGCLEEL